MNAKVQMQHQEHPAKLRECTTNRWGRVPSVVPASCCWVSSHGWTKLRSWRWCCKSTRIPGVSVFVWIWSRCWATYKIPTEFRCSDPAPSVLNDIQQHPTASSNTRFRSWPLGITPNGAQRSDYEAGSKIFFADGAGRSAGPRMVFRLRFGFQLHNIYIHNAQLRS